MFSLQYRDRDGFPLMFNRLPPGVLPPWGFGIFAGGNTSVVASVADKANYVTETTGTASGYDLDAGARVFVAAAGNSAFGIFAGGYTNTRVSVADKANYVTEFTAAASDYDLDAARYGLAAASPSTPGSF
jgi:hypothetical protein